MVAPITLPPPIGPYVGRYVRLRRRHAMLRAAGLAACFFLAWALGCCMIDRVAHLLSAARLALLLVGVGAVVILVCRPLVYWLSRDVNWRAAAADIERRDGRFAQRLQTVMTAFLEPPRFGASREMVDELAREVGHVLAVRRPQALLHWRPTVVPWLAALALALAGFGLSRVPAVGMIPLAQRFITPLRSIPAVTTTRLTLHPLPVSIVEGQPLRVTVSADRLDGGSVMLYYAAVHSSAWSTIPMTPMSLGTFQAVVSPVTQDLRYFARGGDARTVAGFVRVLRKPTLAEMRVRYTYPAYTNRPPLVVSNTDGLIEAPVGTDAAVTFVASEPLVSAVMTLADQKLATIGGDNPRERRVTLRVEKDQHYTLDLVSADQVPGSSRGSMMIRAIPDRPPLVRVLQPPGELRLSPRDILSLPFQALDDYGVTSLTTNIQITASGVDASGEPINLAQGKPATQPSTWGGADASRAVDGKTDGNFAANSVSHTDMMPNAWWQVDLGAVSPVAVIELWNRTDAQSQRLTDFSVFVSDAPFLSDDPAAIAGQAGVATYRIPTQCGTPTRIEVFRTARFVRVQLSKPDYLSLAEVRVLQAKPIAAGNLASRSFETHLPVTGDARQQEGEAVLDLAKIRVGVGDVVSVSVNATDTGKQAGIGGPIRVVVSPRSIDQRTYDRINELKRASLLTSALASQVDAAAKAFEPAAARGTGHVDAYLAALASATRELSGAADTAGVLQSSLLRCIIRSDGPQLSVALTAMVDQLQELTASASALNEKFAFDTSPSEVDRAALAAMLTSSTRIAGHVAAILRGEQAGAVLADLDNLRASEQGTPSGKEAADRARERARRVREDVEAAAKELGLAVDGRDVEGPLRAMVAARLAAMKSYAIPDYVPAAHAYAAAMAARTPLPALVPRLSSGAQAEAIRPDGNLVRARDLQLAAAAALRVRDGAAATRQEFVTSFAQAIAALQREHALPRQPSLPATAPAMPPATAASTTAVAASAPTTAPATTRASTTQPALDEIHGAATDARRKLTLWSHGENEQSANEAAALARAQELAMQANADLTQHAYESADQTDERIARELRLAERTFPRAVERFEQARQDVRRSTEKAKQIDRLSAEQQKLAARAADADRAALRKAQDDLATDMQKAAEDEGDGTSGASDDQRGSSDSRLAAATAVRAAQERLAALPQQLRNVEAAMSERNAAAARLFQLQQASMPPDEQAAAGRAIRGAEEQLRDAEQRLANALKPLGEALAGDVARSLADFTPETAAALRNIAERLQPALSRLQRVNAGGGDDFSSAIADARGAIDAVQTGLKDAQSALLERDPLTAARAYAQVGASSMGDADATRANQQDISAALSRAWDAKIHEAAAARLAGLPTMRPLFTPPPDAGTPPPATPAGGVASRFPMFFDWGRLPWRPAQDINAAPREGDAPGYQDALQAYFQALGVTQPSATPPATPSATPPATQQVKP